MLYYSLYFHFLTHDMVIFSCKTDTFVCYCMLFCIGCCCCCSEIFFTVTGLPKHAVKNAPYLYKMLLYLQHGFEIKQYSCVYRINVV